VQRGKPGEESSVIHPEETDTAGPVPEHCCCLEEVQMDEEKAPNEEQFPVVMIPSKKKEETATELVQFKISLISPVIYQTHTFRSDRAYLETVAARFYDLPDGRRRRFSVKTLERWVRKYRADSADGLKTKTRSDMGSSRTLTLVVMVRIAVIVKEVPQIKCTEVLHRLEGKDGLLEKGAVSVDTIRRFILIHDLRNPVICEERIRKSFVVDNAGDLWEADTCYLFKIPDKKGKLKWVYIQGIMDDHSRRIVSAICYMQDTAENFQKTLFHAISSHIVPICLYCDNGSPYICGQLKEICNRLGITLIHTRSEDGASKGCIERFWLSAVMALLPDLILDKVNTLEGVQQVVDEYVERYNNSLNRGVNGIPNERYQASILRKPGRKAKSLEWLKEQFVNQKWCHLYNDNVIHFNNAHYRIPDELVFKVRQIYKKSVPVRYDPKDIDGTICVVLKGQKHPLSLDDPSENNNKRRNTGGRKAQMAEQAEAKAKRKMSVAEQRAEERYQRRMAGIQLSVREEPLPALNTEIALQEHPMEEKQELLPVDYTVI